MYFYYLQCICSYKSFQYCSMIYCLKMSNLHDFLASIPVVKALKVYQTDPVVL